MFVYVQQQALSYLLAPVSFIQAFYRPRSRMLFRFTKDLSVLICIKKGVRPWEQQRQRNKGLGFSL